MKKIFTLAIITTLTLATWGTNYTIEPKADGKDAIKSYALPIYFNGGTVWGSVVQQIYLASELTAQDAEAGDINAITFYYSAKDDQTVTALSRNIQIWLMEVSASKDSFVVETVPKSAYANDYLSKYLYGADKKAGIKVYEGPLATEAVSSGTIKTVTIDFDSRFTWNGSSNIVLTVFDMSTTDHTISADNYANLRFLISKTAHPRFLHKKWFSTDEDSRTTWIGDMSNNLAGRYGEVYGTSTLAKQVSGRSYVNKIDFSIVAPVPVPTSPSSGNITESSAVISWNAAAGADSYEIRYGTTSGSLGAATNVGNVTSRSLTSLTEETTYFYQIRTKIGSTYSAWTDEASFTTSAAAAHTHDGITFTKWTSTSSLPTSGSYYLNDDVVLTAQATLSGNLNLCLNGHSIYTYTYNIVVDDEQTLAIYDYEGGGEISGHYVATFAQKGLISVLYGGTLSVKAGTINNQYDNEYGEGSIAIYSNGTLKISGAPAITGVTESIYLNTGKVITIESGKPLTNLTPYVVNGVSTVVTSGWTNMGGALPSSHFTSANSTYPGIALNGSGEAQMVKVVALDQDADNSAVISAANNQFVNASLTRSWLADGYYSTLCLPFDLSASQITSVFGSSTEVAQLTSSSIDGEEITITFTSASSIEAGKPYIIKPTLNAVNPVFSGVTIQDIDVEDEKAATTYVDFIGTLSPTYLAASEDILFLGANNAIGWPAAAGYLKGMRAYFQLHSLPAGAPALRHARLIAPGHSTPTALDEANENKNIQKRLENGQLIIIRDGKKYNVIGGQQ